MIVQTEMKDKTKKVINQICDGWIVTSPHSVSSCKLIFWHFELLLSPQNPSGLRIDRLEWPRNTDKVVIV